ncbi:hypothetical protein [Sorangium sp. So ce1182]|uniref:hypothetical protein n=1 Tax=Sorangium sp. So ce1182 TaxID=3133334 RepID=UPI003F5E8AFD
MEDEQGSGQGGALAEALAGWVGARIDAAHANPATELVALAVYGGSPRRVHDALAVYAGARRVASPRS